RSVYRSQATAAPRQCSFVPRAPKMCGRSSCGARTRYPDDSAVDRTDRSSDQPIWFDTCLMERLIYAGLVRSDGSAPLSVHIRPVRANYVSLSGHTSRDLIHRNLPRHSLRLRDRAHLQIGTGRLGFRAVYAARAATENTELCTVRMVERHWFRCLLKC